MKWFFAIFFTFSFIFLSIFSVNCIYGYLFPIKYENEISTACESYNVDPALVAAVINTESGFDKNAISSKGAVGLMQIMPSTAQYLADKLQLATFDLYDENDNINIGTYYLSTLIKSFPDTELAICAYNAGPNNVKNWINKYGDEVIKSIPFKETKNYLQKYLKNYKYYQHKKATFVVNEKK